MANGGAQQFADALQCLEQDREVEKFVGEVFADDVELHRPQQGQAMQGSQGAQEFWQQYLAQFDTVRSTFSRVVDSGDLGVLEWSSEGQRASGDSSGGDISYAGVSILDFDGEGRVRRFATYFDTAAFLPGVRPTVS